MKKTTITMAAAMLAFASQASAFNVDFGSYFSVGDTLGAQVINVPGYGNIALSAAPGSSIEFNANQGSNALELDNNESLIVDFQGATDVTNLAFNYVGVNSAAGEGFTAVGPIFPMQYVLTLNNSNNGAGVSGFSFDASPIPEPSTALFGLIGGLGMLFIRKR